MPFLIHPKLFRKKTRGKGNDFVADGALANRFRFEDRPGRQTPETRGTHGSTFWGKTEIVQIIVEGDFFIWKATRFGQGDTAK